MYYDIEGNALLPKNAELGSPAWKLAVDQWTKQFEDFKGRRINQTTVDRWDISTVFLGLDHRCSDDGPPLIFETMIFDATDRDHRYADRYCRRYSTKLQAIRGHERIVFLVAKGRLPRTTRTLRERIKCWLRRLMPEWAWVVRTNESRPHKECEREQE